MLRKSFLIKIGGSTLGSQDTTFEDLVALQRQGHQMVVVHGGGNTISQWMERLGLHPKFVRGLRATDATTLQVVVAVLAGLVNTEIVSAINSLGGRALGLSGVDGRLLEARISQPELEFVGEVVKVNPEPVHLALQAGYIPVIAPLAFPIEAGEGAMALNVNADTAAAALAAALGSDLVFLTDVPGVLDKDGKLIPHLTAHQAQSLIASGVASGGMVPKLEACLDALKGVNRCHIISGIQPHALLVQIAGKGGGTTIVRDEV